MAKLEIDDWKDAKTPAWFWVVLKAIRNCKARDPWNCCGAISIKETMPRTADARIFVHYTYVWYEGDKLPTRYLNSPDVQKLARLNDMGKRSSIMRAYKQEFKESGRSFPFKLLPIAEGSVDYHIARSIDEVIAILGERGLIDPKVEVCGRRWVP